jgi:hypothetical protein
MLWETSLITLGMLLLSLSLSLSGIEVVEAGSTINKRGWSEIENV